MINRFIAVLRCREHSGGESPRCQVCSAKNEPLMLREVTAFTGRQGSAKNSTFKSEIARSEKNVLHLANMMRNAHDDGTGGQTDFFVFFDNVRSIHNNKDDVLHDLVKFFDDGGVVFERGAAPYPNLSIPFNTFVREVDTTTKRASSELSLTTWVHRAP